MRTFLATTLCVALFLAGCTSGNKNTSGSGAALPADSVLAIAEDAYVFAIPLALMDITRKKLTNVVEPVNGKAAPPNQIAISTSFPDAKFKEVVRPNADTYYSCSSMDLKNEPLVFSLPNTNGRYYLMPMLDAYTNVFASPGKRTDGTDAKTFLITGPQWKGTVPEGMKEIKAPTNMVWLIGRTQVNSKEDGEKVVVPLEKQYSLVPLSAYGKPYTPPKGTVDSTLSKEDPNSQVKAMPLVDFFNYVNTLMIENPPAAADSTAMKRFARIGVAPGAKFDVSSFDTATQRKLAGLPRSVFTKMDEVLVAGVGKPVNGWSILVKGMGNYGTDYDQRALVAYIGLGANLPEDAVYPTCAVDDKNEKLSGANKYVIHFEKGQLPPANAFWSITMYDNDGYFIDNALNRYSIGDRSNLKANADGSVDIYFQNTSPEKDKESNWLPCPAGEFNLTMRLYWPKEELLNGSWTPPPVKRVNG